MQIEVTAIKEIFNMYHIHQEELDRNNRLSYKQRRFFQN